MTDTFNDLAPHIMTITISLLFLCFGLYWAVLPSLPEGSSKLSLPALGFLSLHCHCPQLLRRFLVAGNPRIHRDLFLMPIMYASCLHFFFRQPSHTSLPQIRADRSLKHGLFQRNILVCFLQV